MENEELAALRASMLAATRQPARLRARQARLSAVLTRGDDVVPYILATSCSDPRDRRVRDSIYTFRVLEGGLDRPSSYRPSRRLPARVAVESPVNLTYEPAPIPPRWLVVGISLFAALTFLLNTLVQIFLFR